MKYNVDPNAYKFAQSAAGDWRITLGPSDMLVAEGPAATVALARWLMANLIMIGAPLHSFDSSVRVKQDT